MPVNAEELYEACLVIARQDNLKVCMSESLKGGLMAGAAAFVGGVLLGRNGVALGAALGGLAGTSLCQDYTPMPEILMKMSSRDKQELAVHVQKVLDGIEISDAVMLMALISDPTQAVRGLITTQLTNYAGFKNIKL